MNSYRHAQSSAKKWGGETEDYLPLHEFIDSSKMTLGDVRHRALYHHTLGVWLCQRIFGPTLKITRKYGSRGGSIKVPTRLVAERHIIEDLGFIPTPQDYLRDTPIATWMSGARRSEVNMAELLLTQPVTTFTTGTTTHEEEISE